MIPKENIIKYLLAAASYWVLATGTSLAQDTIENSVEQKLENLAESAENEEDDYSNLLEALYNFKKHPINLNRSNPAELAELGLLDEIQIGNLLKHIDKNGKLATIYELQSIDGFDLQTIESILPYVIVADITALPPMSVKEILKNGQHEFILRSQQVLEDQTGFSSIDSAAIMNAPDSRYIGSSLKAYARYRFTYNNNISAGITAEKDAGELFSKKKNPYDYPAYDSLLNGKQKNGFDFYSAHLFVKNIGKVKALAIGDYQVGFGQGLTAWSGLAYGKSYDAVSIKRSSTGIRPYTSSDENRFFRGVAIAGGVKNMEASGFFSRKKIDAGILLTDSLDTDHVLEVSSLQTSGIHATPSAIADKDAITQTVIGGNIAYKKRNYSIGVTGTNTALSAELISNIVPYSQFQFSGKQISNIGADYSLLFHNINIFGEISSSSTYSPSNPGKHSGIGFLNGCIIALDPRVSISVLHRSFQKSYQNLFANAYSENSSPANEQGIYMGITIKPIQSISVNAYYDHYYFPWLKYQVNSPSEGSEYLLQLNYTPSKKFETYLRLKQKDKFVNSSAPDDIDFIAPYKQTTYRWHVAYQISPSLKLRNRIEMITIDNTAAEKENGYLVYQDVIWNGSQTSAAKWLRKLSLTMRYALFDTKDYNSRIYAFETDLPGSYSIPSYYYKGSRTYVMLNYSITRNIELWLRWSQTYYSNKSVISSGTLNEINGNTKSEVKAELRLRF